MTTWVSSLYGRIAHEVPWPIKAGEGTAKAMCGHVVKRPYGEQFTDRRCKKCKLLSESQNK